MAPDNVEIHYRRLPDRMEVFEQVVVERNDDYVVPFLPASPARRPAMVDGEVMLETGSPLIWFTYPDIWYDIGTFHRADGTLTGYYANLLTPVIMEENRWQTTDLCLDVWVPAQGVEPVLLDEDDFEEALREGWMDSATGHHVQLLAEDLLRQARAGSWPPRHVKEWTLERVRQRLAQSS